jgi:hypothetical protein
MNWTEQEKGWWVCREMKVGVCKEIDHKWHGYIDAKDSLTSTEPFKTMREAMADVERRCRQMDVGS